MLTVRMQGTATGAFHLPEHNASLLFVTLNKSDKDFSPTTQYNDCVINENLFHWQSWNFDSHQNDGGLRYIHQMETHVRSYCSFVKTRKTAIGKNGVDCYSKNGHAVTVLTRQS